MAVQVTQAVLDGITRIRDDGFTNMLDMKRVSELCWYGGWYEASEWIDENPVAYTLGILKGFEVAKA